MYRVTLDALVEGNPLVAWAGSEGPDDTEHVPNDVWEAQTHDFADLDDAKAFIRSLHPEASTHVVLADESGTPFYVQDFGHDDLDAAHPDVVPPSQTPPVQPDEPPVIPDVPVMARQTPSE